MTSTKTISLDFGIPDVEATITFEDEPPRAPEACPMCTAAAASELAFLTICAQCGDDAADCATCTPPATNPGEVPAQQEEPDTRAQGWCIAFQDAAAEMWDFR